MYGQINPADSTAQVVGYWDLNEKQSYIITEEKLKIQGTDTLSREYEKYAVDITIVDATLGRNPRLLTDEYGSAEGRLFFQSRIS